jgi:hypothetical protein
MMKGSQTSEPGFSSLKNSTTEHGKKFFDRNNLYESMVQ